VICRPSIVAGALREPFPGWTDTIAAAGGITLMVGLGVITFIEAKMDNHFDVVPVDIVTNGIIITAAYAAREKGCLHIYNQGTSQINPLSMTMYAENILHYFRYFSFNRRVFPVNVQFVKSRLEYKIKSTLFEALPVQLAELAAKLPYVGSKSMQD
jgi:fatty acyl-CoA reductase